MNDTLPSELEQLKMCSGFFVLAVNDTMNVLSGKWKLPILGSLLFGKLRFKEIEKAIPKISPRMLSKELRDLEDDGIIKRTVYDQIPVMVEYELTTSGESFQAVLDVMLECGLGHRKQMLAQRN